MINFGPVASPAQRLKTRERRKRENVPLHRIWEFIAAWHALHGDVFILDPGRCEGLPCTGNERVDDASVPARVHNGDPQRGS